MGKGLVPIPEGNRSFLYKMRKKQIKKRQKAAKELRKRENQENSRRIVREEVELTSEEILEIEGLNLPAVDEFEQFVNLYESKMNSQV